VESPPRSRSTRDRPAKSPLSEEAILDVALRLVREDGLDAVTMRRLATELDTGPASLYVYFSGRDALLEAMLDRVTGAVPLEEPDPARWREQVHRLLQGMLEAMEAHPGIATVAVGNPPTTDRMLLGGDNLLGLLRAGGVRDQDAAWACDILPLITTSLAVETAVHQARAVGGVPEEEVVARLNQAFRSLDPARFPNLSALGPLMTTGSGDERFHFAIDVFLDGLVARAASSPARPPAGR
jgi:AcrR family transcriptional regulator